MADDRNPVDVATDLLVFAPIGLAVAARELLPTLVSRGRAEIGTQVDLARMVGKLAIRQGPEGVGRALRIARQQLGDFPERVVRDWLAGMTPSASPPDPATTAPRPVPEPIVDPAAGPPPGETSPRVDVPTLSSVGLAILEYDSLAASQVLSRLAGLTPDELEAVRAYEAAGRARRTILGRITQLQA